MDLRKSQSVSDMSEVKNAHGFIKRDSRHGTYFVVALSTLESWVGESGDLRLALRRLRKNGMLITTSRALDTKQVAIPGISKKRRYVCVKRSFARDDQ